MSIAATVKYFGTSPTTIIFQGTSDFDGTTPQALPPVITPGTYTFPAQAAGGLYNFQEQPIQITDITYFGGGTLTIKKSFAGSQITLGTITSAGSFPMTQPIQLAPGEALNFVSSGGTTPKLAVTGQELGNGCL